MDIRKFLPRKLITQPLSQSSSQSQPSVEDEEEQDIDIDFKLAVILVMTTMKLIIQNHSKKYIKNTKK